MHGDEIVKCRLDQSTSTFDIIQNCRKALCSEGIFQWTDHYPTLKTIEDDINLGYLYSLKMQGQIVGIINISTVQEKEYQFVKWKYSDENCLVVHRLAVDPHHQGKGYAQRLMHFAEDYGVKNGFSSIRLDAYSQNVKVLRFYERRGYIKQGEVNFPGREHKFFCYEKRLSKS